MHRAKAKADIKQGPGVDPEKGAAPSFSSISSTI